MKPFHQWLGDLSEELNPSHSNNNSVIIQTDIKPIDMLTTALYMILGMPSTNYDASKFNQIVCDCQIGLDYGFNWLEIGYEEELEMFNKHVKPYIRIDLMGGL